MPLGVITDPHVGDIPSYNNSDRISSHTHTQSVAVAVGLPQLPGCSRQTDSSHPAEPAHTHFDGSSDSSDSDSNVDVNNDEPCMLDTRARDGIDRDQEIPLLCEAGEAEPDISVSDSEGISATDQVLTFLTFLSDIEQPPYDFLDDHLYIKLPKHSPGSPVGPRNAPLDTPREYFQLFMDDAFLEQVCIVFLLSMLLIMVTRRQMTLTFV